MSKKGDQARFNRELCALYLTEEMMEKLKGNGQAAGFVSEVHKQLEAALRLTSSQKERYSQKERKEFWQQVKEAELQCDLSRVATYLQLIAYKFEELSRPESALRFLRKNRSKIQDGDWNRKKLLAQLDRQIQPLERIVASTKKTNQLSSENRDLARAFIAEEIAKRRRGCKVSTEFLQRMHSTICYIEELHEQKAKWPSGSGRKDLRLEIRMQEKNFNLLRIVELYQELVHSFLFEAKPKNALRYLIAAKKNVQNADKYKKRILAKYDEHIAKVRSMIEKANK